MSLIILVFRRRGLHGRRNGIIPDGLDAGEARCMLQEAWDSRLDQVESLLYLDAVIPSDSDSHRLWYCDPCEA